jgi:hypothetical protein
MSFDKLITKVQQAEDALEARERTVSADLRQLKVAWRAAWTPGRIVIAGLAAGYLVGRAEPFKRAAGGGVLQLITALSGLFASSQAQDAAEGADDAAQAAEVTAAAAVGEAPVDAARIDAARVDETLEETGFRRDGPRVQEPRPAGPTPAEAATDVSERRQGYRY